MPIRAGESPRGRRRSHLVLVLAIVLLAPRLGAASPTRPQTPPPQPQGQPPPPAQTPPAQPAQTPPPASPASGMGRVLATITILDGSVRMPGIEVELRPENENITLAKTTTDGAGQVSFPDVPPGRYVIRGTRPGMVTEESSPFVVRPGEQAQVLLDLHLAFAMPDVEVTAPAPAKPAPATPVPFVPSPRVTMPTVSPTQSIQPVSTSDMASGALLNVAPLEGDDFQSLLPLLPGIVRGPDGRLRIKGGAPTTGALQISSASLVDPSSGDFDLELPGQSIESVEVLANPFAAEYGRFSTSVTQVRTRRGTNTWEIKPGNLVPRFRKWFSGIRGFEPRFSMRGPLQKNRVFLSQDFQFRYVATPVRSLLNEPEIALTSFDSFTRLDSVISSRHTLGGGLTLFPRKIERGTMNTFRPPETTPEFNQSGWAMGIGDRFAFASDVVLETTFAGRRFEVNVNTAEDPSLPMIYAPQTQSGTFFNDQEREVTSLQIVEALSISRDRWHGQHVFKVGIDLQASSYSGDSLSRTLEVRRLDGSLAEQTTFGGETTQGVDGVEVGLFAQDRWRVGSRVTFELGLRLDRESVVERVNWSPRAGVSIGVLPEGRGILRGGVGKFVQRTPLNVGAFESFEARTVTRFAPDGSPLGLPMLLRNALVADLRTPEAVVGNIEWAQRFGRRLLFKVDYLKRNGSHEYILDPDPSRGIVELSSGGASRYWELELTSRYLGGERKDITVSYVRSRGSADLNNYDQFYGNFRNPIIRANENNLIATDVPHRVVVRGTIGLPKGWDFVPVAELRSGFPFSAVDEFQDFVGPRNRAGRLPRVTTLDFTLSRMWHVKNKRFRAGIKLYNAFGASADRDVQSNVTSPEFGQFFNPIERSIGFVITSR